MSDSENLIPIDMIENARESATEIVNRTPLIRLDVDAPCDIYLKLENLQPTGAFKIRGAAFGFSLQDPAELAGGVWTSSSGNMAQAVSYMARAYGVPCQVVMPDTAAKTKVAAVERLGGTPIPVSFADWWKANIDRAYPGLKGPFFHAFDDESMMAGNGVIGLEILEDLPDVDTVVAPFGGGGLACGIGSAVKNSGSAARIIGAEYDGLAPLTAALDAGEPVDLEGTPPSYLGGVGGRNVTSSIWPRAQASVDDAATATREEVVEAILLLAEKAKIVTEGAGAVAVATALNGSAGSGKVVCVVSGGNIDMPTFSTIMAGNTP